MGFQLTKPNRKATHLDYEEFCKLQDLVMRMANCTYSQDFIVGKGSPFHVGLRKIEGVDWSVFCFGFSIAGTTVTFSDGEIHHGVRSPVLVSGDDFIISADHQYVWVDYEFGSLATLEGPSTVKPVSEKEHLRQWLAQFRLIGGVVSLERIGHVGNIEIPGAFA